MRRWFGLALGVLVVLADRSRMHASWPCMPVTIQEEIFEADVVLYGSLSNSRLNDEKDPTAGRTADLSVLKVLKDDPILGKRQGVQVPCGSRIKAPRNPPKGLVLCGIAEGTLKPYWFLELKSANSLAYVEGLMRLDRKDRANSFQFFFRHLEDSDPIVASDAFLELTRADYKDYRDVAKKLPADNIAKWLQNPKTPDSRCGFYALLLAHCGTDRQAELLRKMLDDAKVRVGINTDQLLAGYTILKPKEGWKHIRGVLADPKQEFLFRYMALRAVRFLGDQRPDLVDRRDLVEGVCLLLGDSNIADLAIEDLRKWQCWEVCDRVLELFDTDARDIAVLQRSILRYALSCPGMNAAAFVKEQRQLDSELVEHVEELLQLEAKAAKNRRR